MRFGRILAMEGIVTTPEQDRLLAKEFSDAIRDELGELLLAVVHFGSSAGTRSAMYSRDIDMLLVVDDTKRMVSKEVITAYRVITENTAAKVSKRLHITTLRLTAFWEYLRFGDPIVINMLRDGYTLYDHGFFTQMKDELLAGNVRPTMESVWVYWQRAPQTLFNAKWHILQGVIDLYWAVVDASHAILLEKGIVPLAPRHLPGLLIKHIPKHGKKLAPITVTFNKLMHAISERHISEISGKEYEKYYTMAQNFVTDVRGLMTARGK